MVNTIRVKEAFSKKGVILVDVRTPKEFEKSCIPNAINKAILSNEERHVIGILYKQVGKEVAIEKGEEVFFKRAEEYMKSFEEFKDKLIVVYCSRGGMRSKVITELLEQNKYNVLQLYGGYKAYRNYVLNRFKSYTFNCKFVVLHGLTGTGKTELLEKIDYPMIDLEGIAQHRSSLFGAVGLKPRKQKMFENVLLHELDIVNEEKYVLIEGESRKVGDCIIPDFVFSAMKKGIHVDIKCSIKNRVDRIVKEYFDTKEKIEQVRIVIPKLKQALGKKNVEQLLGWMDNGDYDKVTELILLQYYDVRYKHSLEQFKYEYVIDNNDIKKAISEIKSKF